MTLDFTLTEEQSALRHNARQLCCAASERYRTREASSSITEESWAVIAELQAMASLVPRTIGGSERGFRWHSSSKN